MSGISQVPQHPDLTVFRCNKKNQSADFRASDFKCKINGREYFDWIGIDFEGRCLMGWDYSNPEQRIFGRDKYCRLRDEAFDEEVLKTSIQEFLRFTEFGNITTDMGFIMPFTKTIHPGCSLDDLWKGVRGFCYEFEGLESFSVELLQHNLRDWWVDPDFIKIREMFEDRDPTTHADTVEAHMKTLQGRKRNPNILYANPSPAPYADIVAPSWRRPTRSRYMWNEAEKIMTAWEEEKRHKALKAGETREASDQGAKEKAAGEPSE